MSGWAWIATVALADDGTAVRAHVAIALQNRDCKAALAAAQSYATAAPTDPLGPKRVGFTVIDLVKHAHATSPRGWDPVTAIGLADTAH